MQETAARESVVLPYEQAAVLAGKPVQRNENTKGLGQILYVRDSESEHDSDEDPDDDLDI